MARKTPHGGSPPGIGFMRTHFFLKNFSSRIAIYLATTILSFATRTVFIYCLGEEYLGINGLFASLLTVLNLAELGVGTSIVFAMYKPVAENDTEKVKTLMDFYRRSYRIVGFVLLAVGMALIPALPYLAKGSTGLVDLKIVYLLSLLKTVCSYWFFAYKSAILTPTQKGYIVTLWSVIISAAESAAQIAALFLLRSFPALSYYIYCSITLIGAVVNNLAIRRIVDREFPFLKEKDIAPLPKDERDGILKNIVGMATNRICQVLNDGIDSTIISALVGIVSTAVYSNYLVLKGMVNKCLYMIFSSLHASVGNFCATESAQRKEEFLKTLHFIYFWLYGFCAISLWVLFRPFIAGVWLHNTKWLLPEPAEFLVILNFLVEGLAGAVVKYRDVNGLYWQTRYRYAFSSVLNMVLSILLVGPFHLGVTGALLGTTVSLIIMLSYDPVLVYREVFGKGAGEYYRMYFRDLALVLGTGCLVKAVTIPFAAYTVGNFLIKAICCVLIPNGLWILLFRKTEPYRYLREKAAGVTAKVLRRN